MAEKNVHKQNTNESHIHYILNIDAFSLLDLIDLEDIERFQRIFAEAFGLGTFFTDIEGNNYTEVQHYCKVCEYVYKTPEGVRRCKNSDKLLGEESKRLMRPLYARCRSMGFIDACAPIVIAGKHIANIVIGPCNFLGEVNVRRIREYGDEIGADVDGMIDALDLVSTMSQEKFEKIINLLGFISNEFSILGYHKLCLELQVQERTRELFDTNITLKKQLTEIRKKEKELRFHQDQLRSLAAELSLAEERERRTIAQQLHDNIGQSLALSKIRLEKIVNSDAAPFLKAILSQITSSLSKSIEEIRSLTSEFSPPIYYELGFIPAVRSLLKNIQRQHGIHAVLDGEEQHVRLANDTGIVLYQAFQESLMNVVKHAEARAVNVSIKTESDMAYVEVQDDGKGFDVGENNTFKNTDKGFGLFSIKERLRYIGGDIAVESQPGRGTKIILSVPMQVESRKTAWKPGMPISVVIADDHQMIREGFKVLISEEKDIQIIGEASGGREAIQLAGSLSPDVMVIDISMGDTNGIEVTRQITSQNPEIKVIAYSVHADTRFIDDILKAGAAGYVLKDDAVEEVTQCIRSVISGERFFSTGIRSRMIDGFLETLTNGNTISMNVLSSREKDILKAISEGKNTKQIAALFRISSRTVDIHRKHVMDKLNMYSIAELTKFAITMGLTTTKT